MRDERQLSAAAFVKWIVMVAFVVLAAVAGFLFLATQAMRAELDELRPQVAQFEQEKQEWQQKSAENAKPAAEPSTLELPKLRGEVARLRTVEKQYQQLLTENQQLRASVEELQKNKAEAAALVRDATALRSQNAQLQAVLQARVQAEGSCANNLKAIAGAKYRWASELNKTPADTPTDADLFPKYLPQKPVCPDGGVYMLGPVREKPTCSVPGHAY